ncbi:hypothetical protein G3R49_11185 [Shewanella sp. WXL01]|uniref:hypothetical protein n=1 Tax=Shewanella sp. WXL01 TaxID=2709721 RepID=UPI0014384F64|nr:hypothetical protein [Shewanella sp. WXL01]NKF51119.1 hypothetical protein [Shewanella sp. WXL01]
MSTYSQRLKLVQLTAISSLLFALIGFSYNVWRMQASEHNANIRDASFEMLLQLSELELIIYAGHYDQDSKLGSPRKGWVKVGLINDLSLITTPSVQNSTKQLKQTWQQHWQSYQQQQQSTNEIVAQIDQVRVEVRALLKDLN